MTYNWIYMKWDELYLYWLYLSKMVILGTEIESFYTHFETEISPIIDNINILIIYLLSYNLK